MRIIPASRHRIMPWKNGQGSTTEIALAPEGAALDTFDWRLSLAAVTSDGPFSTFPGVDRTLTVLTGAGLALVVDDQAPVRLTPQSAPFSFKGEATTHATLCGESVTDFNVMSRRARLSHRVRRLESATDIEARVEWPDRVLFCQAGAAQVATPSGAYALAAGDSLEDTGAEPQTWLIRLTAPSRLFLVEFRPA